MNKTEIPLKELLFYGNSVSMCWFLCSSTNKTNNAWIQSFNNAVQERNFLFDFTFCFFFTGYYKALFWRVCRDVSVIHIYKTLSSHSPNKDGKNRITSTIFFFSLHAASLLLHCCCCFTEFWNIPQIWTLTFSSRMLIFSCWRLSWSLCSVTALSSSVMLLSWLWITSCGTPQTFRTGSGLDAKPFFFNFQSQYLSVLELKNSFCFIMGQVGQNITAVSM